MKKPKNSPEKKITKKAKRQAKAKAGKAGKATKDVENAQTKPQVSKLAVTPVEPGTTCVSSQITPVPNVLYIAIRNFKTLTEGQELESALGINVL